jgi:hypothetical protein
MITLMLHKYASLNAVSLDNLKIRTFVRFQCKIVNWWYLVIKHLLWVKSVKNQTLVYVRKNCLARPAAELGNSFRTRYLLCLQKKDWLCPLPWGRNVPVKRLCSVNPYLCRILGVRVHRLNQVLAVVWSLFCPISMDVGAVLHHRTFFALRVEISSLLWG